MVRFRFAALVGAGLLAGSTLTGCFGTPFDKGDGSGTGTGRPARGTIDMGKTGGLGSPRGNQTIPPAGTAVQPGNAPDVGPK